MALQINGLSHHVKRTYGPAIVAAVAQADAFLPRVQSGGVEVQEFQLDAAKIFPQQRAQQARCARHGLLCHGFQPCPPQPS